MSLTSSSSSPRRLQLAIHTIQRQGWIIGTTPHFVHSDLILAPLERKTTMIDGMLDIILVEDNSADVEMALDALREHHLANRVKVLKDGEEAVSVLRY